MHNNVEVRNNSMFPKDLKVSNGKSEGSDWLDLPGTYTKKYFLVDQDDIAIPSKLGKWKDLERIITDFNEKDDISVRLR